MLQLMVDFDDPPSFAFSRADFGLRVSPLLDFEVPEAAGFLLCLGFGL